MKQIVVPLTADGQVTLPAEVREALGLTPRGGVIFTIENGNVRLMPAALTVEASHGSVQPHNHPEDFKELSRAVREERVEKIVRKLRRR